MEATRDTISPELLAPRLPVLGYIKIGGKRPESTTSERGKSFQPPVKYDHFKIRTRNRGTDGNFELDKAVHAIVGAEPKELDVRLAFDHRGQNFYAQMTQYSGRTRARECNGEEVLIGDTQTREPCARRKGRDCACKPYGRLAVILEAAPTFGGLYVFRTTSWESVNSLQTALRMFEQQLPSLRGLPLKLMVYPAEVTYKDGQGASKTATAYKVALVLRATFEEARQTALEYHRTNQIAKSEILRLASGTGAALTELDRADEGEIGDEFYPQAAAAEPSRLGAINQQILEGTSVEEPEPEEDPVAKLKRLLTEAKPLLITDQLSRIEGVLEAKDADDLSVAIDWLETKLKEAPQPDQET